MRTVQDDAADLTDLMRCNSEPLWSGLRVALEARGISVGRAAFAESVEQGDDSEFGVLVTDDDEVVQFGFVPSAGTFSEWEAITSRWMDTPYRTSIETAMELLK
jgi:hypothetical protein